MKALIEKQKELIEHLKRRINKEYSDIYLWHDMNTKLEADLAALEAEQENKPDLKELEKRLDESLAKETKESLNEFLTEQSEHRETAEELLNKHLTYGADTYDAGQRENILKAMKQCAQQSIPTEEEIKIMANKWADIYFKDTDTIDKQIKHDVAIIDFILKAKWVLDYINQK